MESHHRQRSQSGHSLVELLVVLAVLGLCLTIGVVCLVDGIDSVEARGAAQSWQAAAAWAQVGAVWQGGEAAVHYDSGRLALESSLDANSGDLGAAAPSVSTIANIVRWQSGDGVVVRFLSSSAAPDGAGSLYFQAGRSRYRVTVRLESGLTVRTHEAGGP